MATFLPRTGDVEARTDVAMKIAVLPRLVNANKYLSSALNLCHHDTSFGMLLRP